MFINTLKFSFFSDVNVTFSIKPLISSFPAMIICCVKATASKAIKPEISSFSSKFFQ